MNSPDRNKRGTINQSLLLNPQTSPGLQSNDMGKKPTTVGRASFRVTNLSVDNTQRKQANGSSGGFITQQSPNKDLSPFKQSPSSPNSFRQHKPTIFLGLYSLNEPANQFTPSNYSLL